MESNEMTKPEAAGQISVAPAGQAEVQPKSAEPPTLALSTAQTLDLLARLSDILLGDPLSERTRDRQKTLGLGIAAGGLIALSGAQLNSIDLFGLKFVGIGKQVLLSSLATASFILLVLFVFSIYLDTIAARYKRLSAESEIAAALRALSLWVEWQKPDRLHFDRVRGAYATQAYAAMMLRQALGERILELMKAQTYEEAKLHKQLGSLLYDGIDIDAMHSSDIEVSTNERRKLVERSMALAQPNVDVVPDKDIQQRLAILRDKVERRTRLRAGIREIELRYEAMISPISSELALVPQPDAIAMLKLGEELSLSFVDLENQSALLQSAIHASERIKRLVTTIECVSLSIAAVVVIALLFQGAISVTVATPTATLKTLTTHVADP